jgi:PBSX family phage terminase large subunit
MELTYLPTGQKIMFFGLDDPGNLKSIKLPFGYVAYVHFEELDQFRGPEEVRNVEQSLLRGGPVAITFKSFNPPASAANWANQYARESKPGQVKHHSTYLETPPEWLGPRFIADAEHLKELHPLAYRNEYLGEVTGGGANVFENIQLRAITDEELGRFDRIYRGIDWGYYPDPWAYNGMHYDAARLTLYIFDEAEAYRKGNEETAQILRDEKGVQPLDLLTADSAEPKSVADYKAFGFYCRGAAKPPGSVEYSMKWLGRLAAIVIDPERCPRTAKEFSEYEFERDKDGNLISAYPDAKNHHIDAVRYGMQPVWKQRGE